MRVLRSASEQVDEPTVLTIGNFDGVHRGHRALLSLVRDYAKQYRLMPAVVTFEPHPREYFSPQTVPPRLTVLREKLELIAEDGIGAALVCRFDAAFARLTAEEFIEHILVRQMRVRYLFVGNDFCFGAGRSGNYEMLKKSGKRYDYNVEAMPNVMINGERVSSSLVRTALAVGDMEKAAYLLGRPYVIDGRVVQGRRIGRSLGFPTANMYIKHDPPPLSGVFAVEVSGLDDVPYRGVANLGLRPTAEMAGAAEVLVPVLEVHLFDFTRTIYGQHLSVRFKHKLRDERKFSSLEQLQAQITQDVAAARAYFDLS